MVINDGNAGRSYCCAEPADKERSRTPDGVPRCGLKEMADQRASHFGRENNWHTLRGHAPSSKTAQCTAGGFLPDCLWRLEIGEAAGTGRPGVALHFSACVRGKWHSGDAAVAATVFAEKTARVDQDAVAGSGIEVSALRVGDTRIVGKSGGFGTAGLLYTLGGGKRVDILEVEVKIAFQLAEFGCLGQAGKGVLFGDTGQGHGSGDKLGDAIGSEVAGGG